MTRNPSVPFRPLGLLKTMIESLGFEVTHCYEDLVFVAHNAFLLRMEDRGEAVSLLFNTESDLDQRQRLTEMFTAAGRAHHLVISCGGTYQMTANKADGTIHLEFHE